jgi:hypothetical protein
MNKLVLLLSIVPSILYGGDCKIDGINVEYREVNNTRLQGQVAQAYISHNKHIIEFSKDIHNLPEVLKTHILEHECSHHRLKHTYMPKSYISDMYEFEADCDAITHLNWKQEQVEKLISIWYEMYPKEYVNIRSEKLKKCMYQN